MRGRKDEGKIRCRKMLILKELAIGKFMYDVYLPSLDKNIYHEHYVQIYPKIFFVKDFDMMLAISNLGIFVQ